jgi:hypothetical protein
MIEQKELDVFQVCRTKWKLARDTHEIFQSEDDYYLAIKKTIFQMYSWLLEKEKLMTEVQVRERWDKNWWATSIENGVREQSEVLDKAATGWILLQKYWETKYLTEVNLNPVGINFEFSSYIHDVHYRIHTDLILGDKNGHFVYRQLGGKLTEAQLYTNLSTKLEVIGLTTALKLPPLNKSHIDITSKGLVEKSLNITPDFLRQAGNIISNISLGIKEGIIYPSPSRSCSDCLYNNKCWIS